MAKDGQERLDLMDKHKQKIGLSYDELVDFRKNNEVSAILQGPELILLCLASLAVLICFVYIFINIFSLCCCKKNNDSSRGRAKFYFCCTLFSCFFFLVAFILSVVFSARLLEDLDEVACVSSLFPNDLINGNTQ